MHPKIDYFFLNVYLSNEMLVYLCSSHQFDQFSISFTLSAKYLIQFHLFNGQFLDGNC